MSNDSEDSEIKQILKMDTFEANNSMEADESSCSSSVCSAPLQHTSNEDLLGPDMDVHCAEESTAMRSALDSGFSSGNRFNERRNEAQENRNESPSSGDSESLRNCTHSVNSSSTSTDSGCIDAHVNRPISGEMDQSPNESYYYQRQPGRNRFVSFSTNHQNRRSSGRVYLSHERTQTHFADYDMMTSPRNDFRTDHWQNNIDARRREHRDFGNVTPYIDNRGRFIHTEGIRDFAYSSSPNYRTTYHDDGYGPADFNQYSGYPAYYQDYPRMQSSYNNIGDQFDGSNNNGVNRNESIYNGGWNEESQTRGQYRQRQSRWDRSRYNGFNDKHARRTNNDVALIARALLSRPDRKMTEKDIFRHIRANDHYVRRSRSRWQKRIRHVLADTKCFTKIFITAKKAGNPHYWLMRPACTNSFMNGTFCASHSRHGNLRFRRIRRSH